MSKVYAQTDTEENVSTALPQKSFLTNWFMLRDRSLLGRYIAFQQTQIHFAAQVILLIYTTLSIYRSTVVYQYFSSKLALINVANSVIMLLVAWVSFILRYLYNKGGIFKDKVILEIAKVFENCWLFFFNLWFCVTIVLACYNECTSGSQIGCSLVPDSIPPDRMIVAMMLPTITYLVIRTARWETVVFCYLMNLFVLLFCMYFYDKKNSITAFWTYFPLSSLALYEYQYQILYVFELSIMQQNVLTENEKLADEAHSIEMRHMIGNVAHDLKTVRTNS